MSRLLIISWQAWAVCIAAALVCSPLCGQEKASQKADKVEKSATEKPTASQQVKDDVQVRFAKASLHVAEAELQQAQEANRKVPGTVSQAELRRLALNVEKVRAQLEMASAGVAPQSVPVARPGTTLAREAAIRSALDETTSVSFHETELQHAVNSLADKHKIPIVLNKKALDDAGMDTHEPITRALREISLRSALKLMLDEFDVTYIVENEVLLITTKDDANQRLQVVIYDVRDLLQHDRQERIAIGGDASAGYDYDSLIETITSNIAANTWDEVGGPGSISPLYGTLVVSQTQEIHEQIAQFISAMRKVRSSRGDAADRKATAEKPPRPFDPSEISVRIYWVSVPQQQYVPVVGNRAELEKESGPGELRQVGGGASTSPPGQRADIQYVNQLAAAIEATVEPASWESKGGSGSIHGLFNAFGTPILVVRQTAAVHLQVERLLKQIYGDSVQTRPQAGGGFF